MLLSDETECTAFERLSEEDIKQIEAGCNLSGLTDKKDDRLNTEVLKKLDTCMEDLIKHLSERSRTAKFLLQYRDYVRVMRHYIMAARTGDWNQNLVSLQNMINLFAAT